MYKNGGFRHHTLSKIIQRKFSSIKITKKDHIYTVLSVSNPFLIIRGLLGCILINVYIETLIMRCKTKDFGNVP